VSRAYAGTDGLERRRDLMERWARYLESSALFGSAATQKWPLVRLNAQGRQSFQNFLKRSGASAV